MADTLQLEARKLVLEAVASIHKSAIAGIAMKLAAKHSADAAGNTLKEVASALRSELQALGISSEKIDQLVSFASDVTAKKSLFGCFQWLSCCSAVVELSQVRVDLSQVRVDLSQVRVDLSQVRVDLSQVRVDLSQASVPQHVDLSQVAVDLSQVAVDLSQATVEVSQTQVQVVQQPEKTISPSQESAAAPQKPPVEGTPQQSTPSSEQLPGATPATPAGQ
jgi:hypothetical protein